MKKIVNTKNAPSAIGPYSQGVNLGNLIFFSGQIPLNPLTGEMVDGDIKAQTKQSLENVKAILSAAGYSLNNVVKATVFIKNMEDFALINEIYNEYLGDAKPARACVEVARLPKDVKVEIEVVAVK